MTRLRILMTTDAVGGVWQYSLDLAEALAPRGVDVVLAAMGPAPDPAQRRAALALANVDLVETGLPLDWLEQGPAPIEAAGATIAALGATWQCDLIQLNMPTLAAATRFDVPVVAVTHGCVATWWQGARDDALAPQYRWHETMMRTGLAHADAVVAPSASYAATVAAHYALPTPPRVVHNGRHPLLRTGAPAGDRARAGHDVQVLTVGRLWDRAKNVDTLDRAAATIGVPVHAAGALRGPHGERAAIGRLVPLGHLDADALGACLAQRPVFVSAARFEPFGLAVLEAALAGCPLVLADIPTFRELWDGAATFVPTEDAGGYAAAIEALRSDPARRRAMGARATVRAARYRPAAAAQAMHTLYTQLAEAAARVAA